jgi:Protein of unknown function (DUF3606)
MADDRNERMSEGYEVAYWSKKWSVTCDQLAKAIRQVSSAVAKRLGKEL